MFGVSLDSPWSHRAWAEALGLGDTVALLSDACREATSGFGVLADSAGVPKADRSAFLVAGGVVTASWSLGGDLPDVDAVIAAARATA